MAVADIISGLQLLKDLVEWLDTKRGQAGRADGSNGTLLEALSTMHFDENGILGVLRELAAGQEMRPRHRKTLLDFHYAGPEVGMALQSLADSYADTSGLTIQQRKALRGLIPVKSSVRAEVGRLFAEQTGFGETCAPDDVKGMILRIEEMNEAIEAIDDGMPRR
ncbi:MAG: hypothetical protein AB8B58_19670 [Roseobacter sp.]